MWRHFCLPLVVGLAGAAAQAQPAVYLLDPAHTFITAEVMHFGTSTIRVRFGPPSGHVTLDRTARTGSVSLRLPMASVDSGLAVFNARLRQGDLLGTEIHPEAYFVAHRFEFDGDTPVSVRGELTLRGLSRALTLTALRFGCHTHPDHGREVCGGDFEGTLRRSDFGAHFGAPFVADTVRLVVQVEGVRQ